MANLGNPQPLVLAEQAVRDVVDPHINPAAGETYRLERERPESRITGYVVKAAFRDQRSTERQRWLWDLFRASFGSESQQIGLVLAFTPEEFAEYQEDARAA